MAYRDEAKTSYAGKMDRMGLTVSTASMGGDYGKGHSGPADDGTEGREANHRAEGYADQDDMDRTIRGKEAKPRLDRPGYKRGGRVKAGATVNVIVAPSAPAAGGPPMPPPGPPPGAMPPPPMMPPGAGGPGDDASMGPLPRKRGGPVPNMNAGAGGGLGRLEKVKAYGAKA